MRPAAILAIIGLMVACATPLDVRADRGRVRPSVETTQKARGNAGFAKASQEILAKMKRINAQTKAGTSYRIYSAVVQDVGVDLVMFEESDAGKSAPQFVGQLNKVHEHHRRALRAWRWFVEGAPVYADVISGWFDDYPELGVLIQGEGTGRYVPLSPLLDVIWSAAIKDLEGAESLASK